MNHKLMNVAIILNSLFFSHFIRLSSRGGSTIQGDRGVMGITGWGNCKSMLRDIPALSKTNCDCKYRWTSRCVERGKSRL